MSADIEAMARRNLARLLQDVAPEDIDPDGDMVNQYGLTSLNMVLFLTGMCNESGVGVSNFTEEDLADMRTMRDVTSRLIRYADEAG
jgi:hypothetical protein